MADVIFNGTDGRKPLGMAEVSLTIGGVDEEHLRAAGVEVAYNEVTVTRRVFRDGGSEYFINKTPCRLKDIQQLFMGTGVGRTSYSIMAQGNITQILSSKPEDRRLIFEEAAGITKFKAQKKEALRKLEYTEQNLLRVADLVREVKRQIGSLQRQAGKARRYKQLSQELQHLDTQLARHQFDVLQAEIRERAGSRRKPAQRDRDQRPQTCCAAKMRSASCASGFPNWNTRSAAMQQRGLELKGEIDRHESRIQFNEERLREFEAQNAKALADIAQAEERRASPSRNWPRSPSSLAASEAALDAASADACSASRRRCGRSKTDLRAAAGSAAPGAGGGLCRRAGPDPGAQRNQRAGPAEAGQRRPAGKTLGREDPARGRAHAAGNAAAGIRGQCRGGEAQCADPARHGGGAPAAAAAKSRRS